MWEKLKTISQHPAAKFLKKFCGDPVQLYAVFLIMTAMHYYHEEFSWLYTILALGLSYVLMRFYDFVAHRRFLGPLCYLVFLGLGLYATSMVTVFGQRSYPISFFVWFLTPQGVTDFSLEYTVAIYMLMVGFLTSTVYYFAKVRYRMVMQLVIMLIPLSLYAKEARHMPALLVFLLLSSFFLMMVYCRQLKENPDVHLMDGFHSGVSIALYVAAFSVIAAIIPKPQFQANREFIDNAMSFSTWSDTLMNAISMFTESTNNSYSVSNNARTLYYVSAPESIRLRTQTFTYYKEDDSWNAVEVYDRPDQKYEAPLTYEPRQLTQAIVDAAEADAAFAEKYGLTDVCTITLPKQGVKTAAFFPVWYNVTALPTPSRTLQIPVISAEQIKRSYTLTLSMNLRENGAAVQYYSDFYVRNSEEAQVLRCLKKETYPELLEEAAEILKDKDPEASALLSGVYQEQHQADSYLDAVNLLDYSSETVDKLAAEITGGLESDLEKALAIEQYFTDQQYVYDMSYKKAEGDNIDQFLTVSHTGVCYEYATAMTLLCRSAGLPARYVQGFNLSEMHKERGRYSNGMYFEPNYVIKMRDAHAFPEVYISGYGWVSFEPTVASGDAEAGIAENQNVMRLGYIMLVILLIVLAFWAILPWIREKRFCRNVPGMEPDAAASAVFRRMRTSLHLPDSVTVRELKEQCAVFFADEQFFHAVNALLYNPTKHSSMTSPQLAETYIRWQAQRKAYDKEQKKLRKEQKKANVNV